MFKLIHAEFYKVFRRPTFYILLSSLLFFAVAIVLIAIRGRNAGTVTGAFRVAPTLLTYPAALLPLVTELTLGEELREHTAKNTIEYGTGRNVYFISKLISTILLGMLLLILVYSAYFAAAALSMPLGQGVWPELLQATFSRIGTAFAVFIAASGMSLFLLTLFNRSVLAIFAYYGIFYFTEIIFDAFNFSFGTKYLLSVQVTALTGEDPPQYGFILAVSAVTFLVFFTGSLITLRNKDLT
jgi:hypothetical protein